MTVHWSKKLFVENPRLFLPVLMSAMKDAESEVSGLCKIFEEFGVKPGSRILDVSCGIGRHSIPLARRGYVVVGYDPSPFFIRHAQRYADCKLHSLKAIRFYEGQIDAVSEVLRLHGEQKFDVIISMFNSLGYASKEDDFRLFVDLLSMANPSGLFIAEIENRDWRMRNFVHETIHKLEGVQIHENWNFNFENSTASSTTKFYGKQSTSDIFDPVLDITICLRLYSLHELIELLEIAGWNHIRSYGSVALLTPISIDSENIVTVSMKS